MCLTDNKGNVSVAITKWTKGRVLCENLLKYGDEPIKMFDPEMNEEGYLFNMSNIKVQDSKLYFILHKAEQI